MILRYKDYLLRNLIQEDKDLIYKWRNLSSIRNMMINTNKILWSEHNIWFENAILKEPELHYIFCYKENPIGYIGYKIEDEKILSPGLYIGEKISSEAGLYIVAFSIDVAFNILNANTLKTKIKLKNKPSIGISKYMGYKLYCYDDEYYLAILNKNEWKHKLGVNFKEYAK
ncbi:hypothetical protein [uncultured Megamonas sp.]|uniref:hypothetical protein n=1 Tax=uncultured Megamonas sp. TaxID=286140 RepID=UPI00259307D7|nr:hypothetical protein [uncultured Megamonas sp.]